MTKSLAIIYLLFMTSCLSTARNHSKTWSYELFSKQYKHKNDVLAKWGPPPEKGKSTIAGLTLSYYRYNSTYSHFADFFIDPQSGQVLEKSFSPPKGTLEFNTEQLINKRFKGLHFEKIPVRCRHHHELILLNRANNIVIMTQEEPDPTVVTVAFSSKNLLDLRFKEMKNKKCRYH